MRALVFDFDGVLVDSSPETFWVAVRTWAVLRAPSRLTDSPLPGLGDPDLKGAIAAHPAWPTFMALMPLGNRAEDFAVALAAWESGVCLEDQAAYDAYSRAQSSDWLESFHHRFYSVRTAARTAHRAAWIGLHAPYPGVVAVLRNREGSVPFTIATAKDTPSVVALLRAFEIDGLFPEDLIFDKELGRAKTEHLRGVATALAVEASDLTFVDDRLAHLEAVAPSGVRTVLAAWGYNGERERVAARARGHAVATLDTLDAVLFG